VKSTSGEGQTVGGCTYVEDEERVLGGHDLGWAVRGDLGDFLVPPQIPSLGPGDLAASALEDKDMLYVGALLDCGVDDHLSGDGLAATLSLIRRDHDTGLAVVDAITERLSREAREHDGVDRADTRTREERGDGLPHHGQVDGYGVALLDPKRFERVGDAADRAQQLGVGDLAPLIGFVSLVYDCSLYGSGSAHVEI
jgi:hypothetical protein